MPLNPRMGRGPFSTPRGPWWSSLATIANQIGASGSLTYQKRRPRLSSAEWRIFALVAAGPHVCGMELAQFPSIDKASVSRTIRTLADRDLLQVNATENPNRNQQALHL